MSIIHVNTIAATIGFTLNFVYSYCPRSDINKNGKRETKLKLFFFNSRFGVILNIINISINKRILKLIEKYNTTYLYSR